MVLIMCIGRSEWIGLRQHETGYNRRLWSSRRKNNEKRVVDFHAERRMCVGKTYFNHKSLHKLERAKTEHRKEKVRQRGKEGTQNNISRPMTSLVPI